jgi:hypothetical protein
METTDKKLTAQESLDIIAAMIQQAKGNVQKNSFYFLLWGWVVALANLGMYVLIHINYPRPYLIWLITVPAWILSMYNGFRHGKQKQNKTLLGQITLWTWVSFGITVAVLIFFGYKINFQLNPLILLISAIPTLVSGIVLRFRPLVMGGVLFWVFGITGFLVPMAYQNLVGALAVICGYLVPGYMLKDKHED